jgi:N-methylhydantoinase B
MTQELDRIKYEIFRRRLFNILEEGRIAMGMVSGSPVVVEGGETMCSLHTDNGDTILVAAGILLHAIGARDFIRKAVEWYEDNPGIFEGDQFFFNDPYIGGQHLADMVVIKPIFHEGKRIAWVGSIMHTAETGGIEPGGMPSSSTEIFHEGIRILGLKVVEKGRFRKDVFHTITLQVRDPVLIGLDLKAKIAANNVCARSYLKLVEQYGLDFTTLAGEKMIDDVEVQARAKLRTIPNGTWRSRLHQDNDGLTERPFQVVCTMTKRDDEVIFDYSGSSPQNQGSINSTYNATWGSLFVTLCSQLFWDVNWNEGIMKVLKVIAPEGTVVNCRFPAAVANSAPKVGTLVSETAHECIAKALYAAGFHEDVTSGWYGGSGAPYFGGRNQYGNVCSGMILDSFASGVGATPFRDGVNSGGTMMNPQSTISDVELIELSVPFLYLYRKQLTDSSGLGKYRGGMGIEAAYLVYGTNDFQLGFTGVGKKTPTNFGMFGGFPCSLQERFIVRNSNIFDVLRSSKSPTSIEELTKLGGDMQSTSPSFKVMPVKEGDIFVSCYPGGGGYGDPLQRDPAEVLEDFIQGAISSNLVLDGYGVVLKRVEAGLQVDYVSTKAKRESMIKARLERKGEYENS